MDRLWIWFADNGNIRKWQREPFPEGAEYVAALSLPDQPDAARARVRVKGLEWNNSGPGTSYAETVFGRYCATFRGSFWFNGGPTTRLDEPTLEAAKAAAQADYERRILSQIVMGE